MILSLALGESYGIHPGAWRMPHADLDAFISVDAQIRTAQAGERAGLDFVFFPDRVFLKSDLEGGAPLFTMEPLVVLAAVASHTSRIGLVPSVSTSFNEPYTLARQLRALDILSHGRAGWNVVPSYEPEAFANYGRPVPNREEKYERLQESVEITQALWGSWGREAKGPDPASGQFADMAHIRPVNFQGRHVGSRGPLQIPPSPQGQPVLFMPSASGRGLQLAGRYAGGVIGMPSTLEESRAQRDYLRAAANEAGRDPDEVKFLSFVTFGLGAPHEEAVARRRALEEHADPAPRAAHLSALIGIHIGVDELDEPLSPDQLAGVRAHSRAPQAARAVDLLRQGHTPRDVLAHGVLDLNPSLVGTGEDAADLLQEWFEAEVTDGFILVPDDQYDAIDLFGDLVVPVLRERGLRPETYAGTTLRDHLGLPDQLGRDPRVSGVSQ